MFVGVTIVACDTQSRKFSTDQNELAEAFDPTKFKVRSVNEGGSFRAIAITPVLLRPLQSSKFRRSFNTDFGILPAKLESPASLILLQPWKPMLSIFNLGGNPSAMAARLVSSKRSKRPKLMFSARRSVSAASAAGSPHSWTLPLSS